MPGAKVFISYCHEDCEHLDRLRTHFGLLQSQHTVEVWDDSRICPGDDWKKSIEEAISSSDLYVCLISADFFASEFIREREIPLLLKALETGKRLLPMYVGPLGLDEHPFCRLQGLNTPDRPLQNMNKAEREVFYAEATKSIREALQSISETPPFAAAAELVMSEQVEVREMIMPTLRTEHLSVAMHEGPALYNIVLIGQCGVGKSELFNYLFGKPLRETGVGKPVTERGFHKQAFELKGVRGNLFDSWGLEVGNHEEWQKELDKELAERGTDKPADAWFHTILFCVEASGARILPFEVDIIRKFLQEKYNVIIVLTKSDVASAGKRAKLRDAIYAEINSEIPCIEVGSKEEELPIGKTRTFGAEELMEQIFLSFWDSVAKRLPSRCCSLVAKEIDVWLSKAQEYLETQTGWFNQKAIAEQLQKDFERLNERLFCKDGLCEQIFRKELSRVAQVYFNDAIPDNWVIFTKSLGTLIWLRGALLGFPSLIIEILPAIYDGAMLGALGVRTGLFAANLAGKKAFKEAMFYGLETAAEETKGALRESELELERVIREKIASRSILFSS